jgi:hypothetical protein
MDSAEWDIASASTKAVDGFMLEEYKTIAQAHFDLQSGLRQSFRFYLGIVAIPFTVIAVALKDPALSIVKLPEILAYLFVAMPSIGLLLFIHMMNTLFDLILYTRTVNGVRSYFVARSLYLTPSMTLPDFLKLPTDQRRPPYRQGPGEAYWWLFCLIAVINSAYAFVAGVNFLFTWGAVTVSCGLFFLHVVIYYGFSGVRERREIPARRP